MNQSQDHNPDSSNIDSAKRTMRAHVRGLLTKLEAQNPNYFVQRGAHIAGRLRAMTEVTSARTVLAYCPLPREPDFTSLFPHLRGLALPRVNADAAIEPGTMLARDISSKRSQMAAFAIDPHQWESALVTGYFGIREPNFACSRIDPSEIEVILLPGLAFDSFGGRLGKGRGFYDVFLNENWPTGKRPLLIGICLEDQIVDRVPMAASDVFVRRVVTDLRTLECSGN